MPRTRPVLMEILAVGEVSQHALWKTSWLTANAKGLENMENPPYRTVGEVQVDSFALPHLASSSH
ncbi:MAG: hypothetical protein ACYDAQ_05965 [Mycobacteriales bacterium]